MQAIVQSDTTSRHGDWMQTVTGRQFWPLDPRPEEVHIEDIAHALSMICRFGGHCLEFYSVAEHCCHVSDYCPTKDKLWGLLHDSTEAYAGDIIRPIKPWLNGYKGIELRIMECVCQRFNLMPIQPDNVSIIDQRILGNEARDIMAPPPIPWYFIGESLPKLKIQCWSPKQARMEFAERFYRLYAGE